MPKFILASQSPRRAELLRQLGLSFEIMPSHVNEERVSEANPLTHVKKLAKLKAQAVSKQVNEGVIIGVDTVVFINKLTLSKPKDRADAIRMLKELSGKVHRVVSGICVINKYSNETVTKTVTTQVKFRELNDKLIRWYIETGEPFGKAGGYAIQGRGVILIEWIKGDYYSVVGLPLFTLAKILKEMNALQF